MKEDREAIDIIEKLRADFQVKTLDPITMTELKVPFLQPSYVAGGKIEGGRLQSDVRSRRRTSARAARDGRAGERRGAAAGRCASDGHPVCAGADDARAAAHRPRGYVVFKVGAGRGGHLIRALTAHGVEDYAFFAQQPASESLAYKLVLDDHVAGLRLVNNLIEALDAGGRAAAAGRCASADRLDRNRARGEPVAGRLWPIAAWSRRSVALPADRQDLHRHCVVDRAKPSAILR